MYPRWHLINIDTFQNLQAAQLLATQQKQQQQQQVRQLLASTQPAVQVGVVFAKVLSALLYVQHFFNAPF